MTKKPLPWMATLVATPVFWMPPCPKFGEIDPVVTPRPTCAGFALVPPTDWLTRSENSTVLALKPTVLRFARLLPMTSSFCCWALSPERLVENDINWSLQWSWTSWPGVVGAAAAASCPGKSSAMLESVVFTCCSCSSELNCASCAMN